MRPLIAAAMAVAITSMIAVGCGPSEEIRTYTVPKPTPPVRMVGAMIPVEGGAWFFKMQGPYALVSDRVDEFWSLIDSVRFTKDPIEPTWTLPEGWKRAPNELREMRYATLTSGGDYPLEVAVSRFEQLNMTDEQFRSANINRWRRLLSVEEVPQDALDSVIERRKLGDWEALCVDLAGEETRGGRPMASMPATPPPRSGDGPSYDRPEGWKDRPLKPFSIATFALPPVDGATAEVTISQVGGGLPANAGRWFGQAGLAPPSSPDELAQHLEPVDGAQGDAKMMVLSKDEEPGTKTLVIVAMQESGRDWYIKYTGTRKDWGQHRAAFESLVKSIDFSGESQ